MIVKQIGQVGRAALIEWQEDGKTVRGYLPAIELTRKPGRAYEPNHYEAAKPNLAAPYGLPWAELITLTATPAEIEAELHKYGIWTADDVERNHTQALAAFQSIYARDLMNLIRAARDYQSAIDSR